MKKDFKKMIAVYYCIIFYTLLLYKAFNGLLLVQLKPVFFYAREDIFAWLLMQTGIHQWLINHPGGYVYFDLLYYTAPALLLLFIYKKPALTSYVALYMLAANWLYIQTYTLYPTGQIGHYIAWLIFPIFFIAKKEETSKLLFEGLRYFFLFFFLTAGLWKIINGGIYNPLQLSGVLLEQHKELLTNSATYWQAQMISWLIKNSNFSYALFVASALMEMTFIVGFFTQRYDKLLIAIFIIFLFADFMVMRILYYETLPFLLTLYLNPVKKYPAIG